MESRTRLAAKLLFLFCSEWALLRQVTRILAIVSFWPLIALRPSWSCSCLRGFFYYSIDCFLVSLLFFLPISDKIISCSLDCFVHFVPLGDFAVFQWVWINRMCLSYCSPGAGMRSGFELEWILGFAHSISYTLSNIQYILSLWLVQ
jgi:hypothetical protein